MSLNLEKLDNESELEYFERLEKLKDENKENLELHIEILSKIINIEWKEVFERLANN